MIVDINECAPGVINKCSPEADCIDRKGGYECICHPGFADIGDGFTCEGMAMFHSNTQCGRDQVIIYLVYLLLV